MTPEQARMARAALCWSQTVAARNLGVCRSSIARLEIDSRPIKLSTIQSMQARYEAHGVRFLSEGDLVGVAVIGLDPCHGVS